MKKIILLNIFLSFNLLAKIYGQGTWTQKANFSGGIREGAVCFSIGTKIYLVGGRSNTGYPSDFWEWDENTNIWIQKANFPGKPRYYASGFSIGNKGYVGVGYDGITSCRDFWEWDQGTNTWTRKADFVGDARHHAVSFSIGMKGYIGTGWNDNCSSAGLQDFWEWDQNANTWIQKANFAGTGRQGAVGFSIGTKGYIGTGQDYFNPYGSSHNANDFWEWDQSMNTWAKKAGMGSSGRYHGIGFSIGTKGYIGFGMDTTSAIRTDFWEWDQNSDQWTLQAHAGCGARWLATGFSSGSKGYVAVGIDSTTIATKDLWEFDPRATTGIVASVKKDQINKINFYPNPNKGSFVINIPVLSENMKLEIYNALGEKIHHERLTNNANEILLKEGSGMYYTRITIGTEIISSSKIVIE